MTITLDRPTASQTVPAPRSSEDDALLHWAANLSYSVRGLALALSDMPTTHKAQNDALRWESQKGVGILPNRRAALVVARWAKQGVDRHPDGERGLWRAGFLSRWTHRSGNMSVPAWRSLCKPFGGARRVDAGSGIAWFFTSFHPNAETDMPRQSPLRLTMPAVTLEEESWGPSHHPAAPVTVQESTEDLHRLAECIEGLALDFRDGAFELTQDGELLTVPQFRNLYRFL